MNKIKLPMRKGIGIIILNKNNRVFVGKRKDNPGDNWQMPQGGVDKGEDYISAMQRELFEETSIKNVKIIKEIENILKREGLSDKEKYVASYKIETLKEINQ
mgnify:CR=1 FL=1